MDSHANYEPGDIIYVDMYGGFYAEVIPLEESPFSHDTTPRTVPCRHLTDAPKMEQVKDYKVGFLNGYGRKDTRLVSPDEYSKLTFLESCPQCERHTKLYDYLCKECRFGLPI